MGSSGWERFVGWVGRSVAAELVAATDRELLDRFVHDRDSTAFELLVWRHGAMVFGVCCRAIRDTHLAEDAFQATFLVLARKAASVRGANLAGWLFRVARRVSARARSRFEPALPTTDRPATEPNSADPELGAVLDAEIARLPERLRLPVVLCYLDGRTTEDAARELGCPRGTVLSRLAAARTKLSDRLTRRGVALPASLVVTGAAHTLSANAPPFPTLLRLVSGVVGTGERAPKAISLSDGVIRAMNTRKLVTAAGLCLMAIGSVCGVGLVAAQGPRLAGSEPAADPFLAAPHAKADPQAAQKPNLEDLAKKAQRLRFLEDQAQLLRGQIADLEKQIQQRTDAADIERFESRLRRVEQRFELERQLLIEDIRDAAAALRETRRQARTVELEKGKDSPEALKLAKQVELLNEDLEKAKTALRVAEDRHEDELTRLRQQLSLLRTDSEKTSTLRTRRDMLRVQLQQVETEILQTRVNLAGAKPDPATPSTVDAKLDQFRSYAVAGVGRRY